MLSRESQWGGVHPPFVRWVGICAPPMIWALPGPRIIAAPWTEMDQVAGLLAVPVKQERQGSMNNKYIKCLST